MQRAYSLASPSDNTSSPRPRRKRNTETSNLSKQNAFGELHGQSATMLGLYEQVDKVAVTEATVLIVGESGTGKELVARTLHERSHRRDKPFIAVNCGAISPNLIEAELLGHEKGSFTGAERQHIGYFERANGGTIFLDEVTETPPDMQVKLLRVLESRSFHRVGGIENVDVDVRVLAATNRDLDVAVSEGAFREDLMYRLAVFPLRMPPLRERRDDIALLAKLFLDQLNQREGTSKTFSKRCIEEMTDYGWPGNVRELKNAVSRAFIMSEETVEMDLSRSVTPVRKLVVRNGCLDVKVGTPLAEVQREIIFATLSHFDNDKRLAAQALGVSLKTLYNRLEAYRTE